MWISSQSEMFLRSTAPDAALRPRRAWIVKTQYGAWAWLRSHPDSLSDWTLRLPGALCVTNCWSSTEISNSLATPPSGSPLESPFVRTKFWGVTGDTRMRTSKAAN